MENLNHDGRLKKIFTGIIGNNKKMILSAFGDDGETSLGTIIDEIGKEVFGGNEEILVEVKKTIGEMIGEEDLLLCVKI